MARLPNYSVLKSSSWLAVCLGLALVAGCQRDETPKPADVETTKVPPKSAGEEAQAVTKSEQEKPAAVAKLTGRQVLERMVAAYRKASSYADKGTVRLLAESGNEKIADQTFPFSVALERPNKLRMQAYRVMLVCDGRTIDAAIENIPNQVLVKPAPPKVDMKLFRIDPSVAMSIGDFAGPPPQLLLLLSDDPMKDLLRGADEPKLLESGQIDNGRDCYRVRIDRPDGASVFWIDQESLVLRRIVLPTDALREGLPQDKPIDKLSLVADFANARLGGPIDPTAFAFEVPKGAEKVTLLVPPHMGQLLSKPTPGFKFFDLDGKPVTPESLVGKVAVIDFWATWCGPCRQSLPELEKVYSRYKNNPKVAFCAVSVDDPRTKNVELTKAFDDLKVKVPLLRDNEHSSDLFKMEGVPTTFIIDAKGIVQDYEAGANPKLAETLPAKLDKVLAGEDIYAPLLKQYHEQLEQLKQDAKTLESSAEAPPSTGAMPAAGVESVVKEEKLPEVKLAPRSEPAQFKLAPLWKCADLKSPGNILIISEKGRPARLLVVDNWDSVAEIGLDGNLVARHKLNLGEREVVGRLRTGAGADGHRYVVAFLTTQQRCHVLDENLNLVAHYPEDALKSPHSGIADVELGDLDGDGHLKMYIGYLGVVGVQALPLPLDGAHRLWSNRSVSNIGGLAIGGPDRQGRRDLFCANNSGSLVLVDAEGQRRNEIAVPKEMLGWIAAADLRGDGQPLLCGLAGSQLGENLAIGLSPKGEELWSYRLPDGLPTSPVEPVIAGRLAADAPGQWLLPSPDGSIHVLAADGKLLDKFNYGAMLQGLATVEIMGHPVLLVSSPNGLEAWKVE